MAKSAKSIKLFRQQLLGWYDRHARTLPWRYKKGQKADPYKVWLSEIMLQQTTVTAVAPYFEKFIKKWPSVKSLAKAPQEDIMNEWAGLGYYSRARNLHKCAQVITNKLKGVFPEDQDELKKLPGIGDYTSAAIRSIAFNKPATVVDGNVERVMARVYAITTPLPHVKKELKEKAKKFFENYTDRPGDLAQAFMDLGATICTPKSPKCMLCPVSQFCEGKKLGIAETLPVPAKAKAKPQKYGDVYWVTNSKGHVLIHRRPAKGMLGGMAALPTSDWLQDGKIKTPLLFGKEKPDVFGKKPVSIRHGFTHFDLELTLKQLKLKNLKPQEGYFWLEPSKIEELGFPTLFKKAVNLFLKSGTTVED